MGRITGVKCTVSECVYWGSGNVCEADAIEVNRNPAQRGAARGAGMEVGRIGERSGARGAARGVDVEVGRIGERGEARGAARDADVEAGRIGERGETLGGGEFTAWASEHTMCKTFKPRAAGYSR